MFWDFVKPTLHTCFSERSFENLRKSLGSGHELRQDGVEEVPPTRILPKGWGGGLGFNKAQEGEQFLILQQLEVREPEMPIR